MRSEATRQYIVHRYWGNVIRKSREMSGNNPVFICSPWNRQSQALKPDLLPEPPVPQLVKMAEDRGVVQTISFNDGNKNRRFIEETDEKPLEEMYCFKDSFLNESIPQMTLAEHAIDKKVDYMAVLRVQDHHPPRIVSTMSTHASHLRLGLAKHSPSLHPGPHGYRG